MAKRSPTPRVYLDSVIFLNVIKQEKGLWGDSLKLLAAAERGDISLVASTLLIAEVGCYKGDLPPREDRDAALERWLRADSIVWAEVDRLTADAARNVSDSWKLRAADAIHLATAIRLRADYFVSRDRGFPYGQTVDGVKVVEPTTLWDLTVEDAEIDAQVEAAEAAASGTDS